MQKIRNAVSAMLVSALIGLGGCATTHAGHNPCNPCAGKKMSQPCNPCGQKNPCNPCNPCGGKAKPKKIHAD